MLSVSSSILGLSVSSGFTILSSSSVISSLSLGFSSGFTVPSGLKFGSNSSQFVFVHVPFSKLCPNAKVSVPTSNTLSSLSERSAQAPSQGGQACVHACVCVCACVLSCFSHVWLYVTPWTVAHQAPLSMGFSRQEYWSGLPCPSPGDLPDPGIEHGSLMSPALAGGFFTTSAMWEAQACERAAALYLLTSQSQAVVTAFS